MAHILQITPTSFSKDGVIGGGERIALYIDQALRMAAATDERPVTTTLLALDGLEKSGSGRDQYQSVVGRAWDAHSLIADDILPTMRLADVVYVHQCLTQVGLFVAAHARLLGKRVIGMDAGAGEAPILSFAPDVSSIFDGFHALSRFAASAYAPYDVPVHVVPGPVDTAAHCPPERAERDATAVLALGRILPHKGFDRIITALPCGMSLTIIGTRYDAEYHDYLVRLAEGKDVRILEGLSDQELRDALHRSGIFVHASTHMDYKGRFYSKPELLGLAPLEALASGLPTIVSDAACLPELTIVPGCTAFREQAELSRLLNEATPPTIAEAEVMHAEVDVHFGPLVVGRRLLTLMLEDQRCASSH